ncbi:unnamed protein product [Symbiodinium natans]|uniref:ABC transporter Uup C-terminal domain-containing protein n=1 Tax=Symbiodinium natans TaxID=878477 RepID=A0A812JAB9_9DINO|nr:unnamed protein product [Symbiodinium natans]
MLQRYSGTLLLVSHDRSLLDGVCDSYVVMQADGSQPQVWTGSFMELLQSQRKQRTSAESPSVAKSKPPSTKSKPKSDKKAERAMVRLEREISLIEEKLASVDEAMAEAWDKPDELEELMAERDELDKAQSLAYERFEELMAG